MAHQAIAEIAVTAGTTTQVTNGSADTYDLVTGFNTAQGADVLSINATPAKASNKITTIFAGIYEINAGVSFEGSASQIYSVQVFTGGAASGIITSRAISVGAGSDRGYMGISGRFLKIAGSVDVDLRVASNGTSDNFIPRHMWLTIRKV
jgi:hypothetical protein